MKRERPDYARLCCADCVELVARRLDGLLAGAEAAALEAHLAACPRCRAEMVLQARIAQALASPQPSPAPGAEPAGLPAGFAAAVSRRAFETRRREQLAQRWGYLIPMAASAVVLLLAVIYRAEIAAAIAPSFSALGRLATAAFGWTGHALSGAYAQTPGGATPITALVAIWGSIACAAAAVVVAASRIFSPAR